MAAATDAVLYSSALWPPLLTLCCTTVRCGRRYWCCAVQQCAVATATDAVLYSSALLPPLLTLRNTFPTLKKLAPSYAEDTLHGGMPECWCPNRAADCLARLSEGNSRRDLLPYRESRVAQKYFLVNVTKYSVCIILFCCCWQFIFCLASRKFHVRYTWLRGYFNMKLS